MTAPTPYLHFPGTARDAVAHGQVVDRFGGHRLVGFADA